MNLGKEHVQVWYCHIALSEASHSSRSIFLVAIWLGTNTSPGLQGSTCSHCSHTTQNRPAVSLGAYGLAPDLRL